jgi:hypothetical protein
MIKLVWTWKSSRGTPTVLPTAPFHLTEEQGNKTRPYTILFFKEKIGENTVCFVNCASLLRNILWRGPTTLPGNSSNLCRVALRSTDIARLCSYRCESCPHQDSQPYLYTSGNIQLKGTPQKFLELPRESSRPHSKLAPEEKQQQLTKHTVLSS